MAGAGPPLIDAHLHLQEDVLQPHLEGVLERARKANLRFMVCNGTHEADWERVAHLARHNSDIIPCFGLHPWYVKDRSPGWLQALEGYLDAMPSAIGEIGLDRWQIGRDEPAQEEVFRAQLELARRRGLPVTIHCLRAWGRLMDILREGPLLEAGMLIHAFGGPHDFVRPLVDMGAYLSFAGNILDDRRKKARASLLQAPLGRLLLETDAPALLPPAEYCTYGEVGPDGETLNEPANLPAILRGIAALRGESPQTVAAAAWENAQRFFGELLCSRNASDASSC